MNTNSTDFACLVTRFLTDYLPHHRCYSKNTILSYRDTLKLFLRFLKETKGISPNSFYIKDFNRELVIEFLEWYRKTGAGISTANQRLAALKTFCEYDRCAEKGLCHKLYGRSVKLDTAGQRCFTACGLR